MNLQSRLQLYDPQFIPVIYDSVCEKLVSYFTVFNDFSNKMASMANSSGSENGFVMPVDAIYVIHYFVHLY